MADDRDVKIVQEALDARIAIGKAVGSATKPASFLTQKIEEATKSWIDPARAIEGMPPNYGKQPLPHVLTFQGLFGTYSRVYRASDEAIKASLDNARFMRNDPIVMECIESRQRSTALLAWHLEPEDEKDHDQEDLCKQIEKILKRIRRFTEYRMNCLHAIWYGHYGIQHSYGWARVGGKSRIMPCPEEGKAESYGWQPLNGDKIVFRYDDGTSDRPKNQVGIRIGARYGAMDRILPERWAQRIEPTDRGPAYFLNNYERQMLTIHKHMIEDAAYEDSIDAGTIHGVGIRSRIYWAWFQKQNALAFLMEYLERSAAGIEIWSYPLGNDAALEEMKKAAEQRISNQHNIIFFPKPMGSEQGDMFNVEHIEPGLAGMEMLNQILTQYFGHMIKRYILGQVLSSEAEATGLGSGVADLHLDTLLQIIAYDAVNLEETLTHELVKRLKDWNFPSARDIEVRFKIQTDNPDIEAKLESWAQAYEMGCKLKERDVMDLIGAAIPNDEDDVLENPATKDQGESENGFSAGGFDSHAALADSLSDRGIDVQPPGGAPPNGQPPNGKPPAKEGEKVMAVQNGKWSAKTVPRGDTGERRKAKERRSRLRRSGYVQVRRGVKKP